MNNKNNNGPVFESGPGWSKKVSVWAGNNKYFIILVVVLLALIWFFGAKRGGNSVENSATSSPTSSSSPVTAAGDVSVVVAEKEGSFIVARHLISKTIESKAMTGITSGQRLYAETTLQAELQPQSLATGQTVSVSSARIQEILSNYANLYPSQRTKWEYMARGIVF